MLNIKPTSQLDDVDREVRSFTIKFALGIGCAMAVGAGIAWLLLI